MDGVFVALIKYNITTSNSGITGHVFGFRGSTVDDTLRW
jgi:hypothetical protein